MISASKAGSKILAKTCSLGPAESVAPRGRLLCRSLDCDGGNGGGGGGLGWASSRGLGLGLAAASGGGAVSHQEGQEVANSYQHEADEGQGGTAAVQKGHRGGEGLEVSCW